MQRQKPELSPDASSDWSIESGEKRRAEVYTYLVPDA